MNEIEEARAKEFRGQLKLIPIAVICLIIVAAIYTLILIDQITVFGIVLWGTAKTLWFLNIVFFGGICAISLTSSVVAIILISLIAKNLNAKTHPWKPLALSSLLLVLSFMALTLANYLNTNIMFNVTPLNEWYENEVGSGMMHTVLIIGAGTLLMLIFSITSSLIAACVSLPRIAKEVSVELSSRH